MKRLVWVAAALVFSFFIYLPDLSFRLPTAEPSAKAAKEKTAKIDKKETKTQKPKRKNVSISVRTERDFGYFIGDLVRIRYEIKMPPDLQLSTKDLPAPSTPVKNGIEIRNLEIKEQKTDAESIYQICATLQFFRVFTEPKELSVPAIAFYYGPKEKPRQHKGSLPKVGIKISPLTGQEPPVLQPPFVPETQPTRIPIAVIFGGAAISLTGILWLASILIALRYHPSCFGRAIRKIKSQKTADFNGIILPLRRSLNEKSGRAIFSQNLQDFFKVLPAAEKKKDEIARLIDISDNLSFNPRFQPDPATLPNLKSQVLAILRYLKRSEKWD